MANPLPLGMKKQEVKGLNDNPYDNEGQQEFQTNQKQGGFRSNQK